MPNIRLIALFKLALLAGLAAPVYAEVVPVVSSKSPIETLSVDQLNNIFLGKENRFPNGEVAVPVDHPEGSSVRDEFYSRFFGRTSKQIKSYWSKLIFTGKGQPPHVLRPQERLKKLVAENPSYIGYMNRTDADASVKIIQLLD